MEWTFFCRCRYGAQPVGSLTNLHCRANSWQRVNQTKALQSEMNKQINDTQTWNWNFYLSFGIYSFSKGIISMKCLDFTSSGLNSTRLVFFTLKPLQISERPCMWLASCLKGDILLFSAPVTVCSWLLPLCWQQWSCSCALSEVGLLTWWGN